MSGGVSSFSFFTVVPVFPCPLKWQPHRLAPLWPGSPNSSPSAKPHASSMWNVSRPRCPRVGPRPQNPVQYPGTYTMPVGHAAPVRLKSCPAEWMSGLVMCHVLGCSLIVWGTPHSQRPSVQWCNTPILTPRPPFRSPLCCLSLSNGLFDTAASPGQTDTAPFCV